MRVSIIAQGIPGGTACMHAYLGGIAGLGPGDHDTEALQYIVAAAECIRVRWAGDAGMRLRQEQGTLG